MKLDTKTLDVIDQLVDELAPRDIPEAYIEPALLRLCLADLRAGKALDDAGVPE